MASKKTYDKKKDFIQILSMMSDNEINEYIKRHGRGPKPVEMCRIVDNSVPYEERHKVVTKL